VLHFKSMQKNKNSKRNKDTSAGSVYDSASWIHDVPAIWADSVATDGVDDDDEGDERGRSHQNTVNDNIDYELFRKDSRVSIARWLIVNFFRARFNAQSKLVGMKLKAITQKLERRM